MKTIQLFGKEYKIAFNLAVQRTFEKLTDLDFDLALLAHQEHRINLYISVIIANNEMTEEEVAEFTKSFMYEASFDDLKMIDTLTNEALTAWYNIPPSAKIEVPEEEKSEEEKNA